MPEILIVYYSRAGNTEKLANAIAEGVREGGANPTVKSAEDVDVNTLPDFDGIIAGSPVYFGSMAAELKKFFDESVVVRKNLVNKVGAAFATSAHRTGGKETTILSILQAMLICGMVIVGDPLETGGHYGAAGSDDAGLKEGRALGKRVAGIVTLMNK
ncbi:MAG: NAD(P)H-dependent oxidoreductase [Candidatus Methanoperedens sp.]|jgi:NAD(P)H dehydrogenase (quinone)|nr:NAD(P)H-dependent oxidoreductase [Candidatus Methanoperedens sp.]PKL53929.1 MAG: flavodoxin [Candidatus Methanoperedenaceae archaeon HGW-Methanoperedenaceae-1]